jgi:transposase
MIYDNVTLMSEERVMVTERDLLRMDVIARAARRELTAGEVARMLGLSVRQVRRLIRVHREKGAMGLVHGNRGRGSTRRLPETTRAQVMALLRTDYVDYNTRHIRDELEEEHGLCLSYATVRRLREAAGIPSPYSHRVRRHRLRRERGAQEGMLLQADGSDHDWLEGRGPQLTLIAYIDDATGQIVGATFREQEDAVGYLQVLWEICRRQGVPRMLYTDRHTILRSPRKATLEQKLRGETPKSQVGRALEQLGIEHIPARSPQAKGRVERLFGTLQDRLVKALRREGATSREGANRVLARYIPRHNRHFARPAAQPQSAYRPWPEGLVAKQIFAFHYERVVGNDNTFAFGGLRLPIAPGPRRCSYARARVTVHLHLDGELCVYYQGERIARFAHAPHVPVRVDRFTPAEPIPLPPTVGPEPEEEPTPVEPPRPPVRPGPDHPWRKPYKSQEQKQGDIFIDKSG